MHVIHQSDVNWPDRLPFEVVERKGKGHPDTITDAIVEEISRSYSAFCMDRWGKILHHNVDKAQITGGRVHLEFGNSRYLKPVTIYLSGRATFRYGDEEIPTEVLGLRAVEEVVKRFDRFPPYTIIDHISEGAPELKSLSERQPKANDTSVGVGFAPFTPLEQLVMNVEKYLNGPGKKRWTGEDVKVMGVRKGDNMELTVAVAFLVDELDDIHDYYEKKTALEEELKERFGINVRVNAADDGPNAYLTLSGLSIEMGDDGSVGRGNRTSGLITPMRPMTLEAAAGKNPFNHVGKIYAVAAQQIAQRIYEEDQTPVYVYLVSRIGTHIKEPWLAAIQGGGPSAERILQEELERIPEMTDGFVKGRYRLF